MINIAIFGVPGAGKGTQCKLLSSKLDLVHISTGDLIRKEISDKTTIGIEIQKIINAGILVSDSIVSEMFGKKMRNSLKSNGFLLDGFPRTLEQARMLNEIFASLNLKLDAFVELILTEKESTERILKRAEIEGRLDDNPETLKSRFKEYESKTAPIADYYKKKGLFTSVDGTGTIEEVFERILKVIKI